MNAIGRALHSEDDPNDVELTLAALTERGLADEMVAVRDGAQCFDREVVRGASEVGAISAVVSGSAPRSPARLGQ